MRNKTAKMIPMDSGVMHNVENILQRDESERVWVMACCSVLKELGLDGTCGNENEVVKC